MGPFKHDFCSLYILELLGFVIVHLSVTPAYKLTWCSCENV